MNQDSKFETIINSDVSSEDRQMYQPQAQMTMPYQTAGYPTPGQPFPGYQTAGYPKSGYQTAGYPKSGYPTAMHPTPGYPTTPYPTGTLPGTQMTGYPSQLPPQFPQQVQISTPAGAPITTPGVGPFTGVPGIAPPGVLPLEQSYIENILRLNLGRRVKVYTTYENNTQWNAKIYTGILDEAGRDHIIIRDEAAGKSYLLLMVNLDWVEIEGEFEYEAPAFPGTLQAPAPFR